MRAALAVALFLRPGLLLLDEPTNHLDLPATIWLASYLNSRECANTAVLLVTHSADFVAETATHLVHLDHFKKKLVVQKHADVWRFLAAAPERFKQEKARYEAQRARLKNLKTKSGLSGDAATAARAQGGGQIANRVKKKQTAKRRERRTARRRRRLVAQTARVPGVVYVPRVGG